MVIIGLVVVVVVGLVLGIVLHDPLWFIAAVLVAAYTGSLYWARRKGQRRLGNLRGAGRCAETHDVSSPASFADALEQASGTDGEYDESDRGADDEREVWVIDGSPHYHRSGCRLLTAAAEPVPHSQAVEDGFTRCPVCEPDNPAPQSAVPRTVRTSVGIARPAEPVLASVVEPPVAADLPPAEVWVVDGEPEYHLVGCPALGLAAESVPLEQAVEDGFVPCSLCEPDRELVVVAPVAEADGARSVRSVARIGDVWVMDGEPHFHTLSCSVLDDTAEPIPHEQAIEDGFAECPICQPDSLVYDTPLEPEPAVEAEPEPLPQPDPEPAVEAEPEPVPQPEPEPAVEAEPEPLPEPEPEPAGAAEALGRGETTETMGGSEAGAAQASEPPEASAASAAARVDETLAELDAITSDLARPSLPGDVWVIGGKLRYHRHDCLLVKGKAEAVILSREQAVADGFQPCPLCRADVR